MLRAYGIAAGAVVVLLMLDRSEREHPGDVLIDAARGPLPLGWWGLALAFAAAAVLGLVHRRAWTRWLGVAAVVLWLGHGCMTAALRVT